MFAEQNYAMKSYKNRYATLKIFTQSVLLTMPFQ